MNLGNYRLLAQLGAGRDGVAYRAYPLPEGEGLPGTLVEIRTLEKARANPERWRGLARRLHVAAMLDHPAAIQIRELHLEHDPPYLVLEWLAGTSLANALMNRVPLPLGEASPLILELADLLSAGHRLGLSHGRLCPGDVLLTDGQGLKIDFTGVRAAPEDFRSLEDFGSLVVPEDAFPDQAADVYSFGMLLRWLLRGDPNQTRSPSPQPLSLGERGRGEGAEAEPAPLTAEAPDLGPLIEEMVTQEPSERPQMPEVHQRLTQLLCAPEAPGTVVSESLALLSGTTRPPSDEWAGQSGTAVAPPAVADLPSSERSGLAALLNKLAQEKTVIVANVAGRERLGRFRLLEKLGQGGMGTVYRAEDPTDGAIVAIKVLHSEVAQQANARRRFSREARLLAEVNNPYVTNLLEFNEDEGVHYLVLEFVAGQSLSQFLTERGRLEEPLALAIMADVCRALVEAHRRGIVHRDIKPENILLVSGGVVSGEWSERGPTTHDSPLTTHHSPKVKLSDFGLARHVVESESVRVTQTGAILGTPLYMAPEQGSGRGTVDPRSDIYSIGATLFHLLGGRPPFVGSNLVNLVAMHCNDPPPPLGKLNANVSEAVCQIVEKTLAKQPEHRYADAQALLADLERALRGEPTSIVVHPQLPACDPRKMFAYDWTWELESSPAQLWPHVSNTQRLNRAVHLPAVQFTTERDAQGNGKRLGRLRKTGFTAIWHEHPFEWIEQRRFAVLRECTEGPFKWLVSIVELAPRAGGGTTLTHRVRVEPKGVLGRLGAAVEVGMRGRRGLDRVYRRIDAALTGKLGNSPWIDPFEEPARISRAQRRQLDQVLDRLAGCGLDPSVVEQLGDFLAIAPPQEVARIRPLVLAHRLGLDPEQFVAACLYGAREGLLILLWDILCPLCRIPAHVKDTLRALREHAYCPACNLEFDLDFANSVEMIFRAHPEIRNVETRTYCVGGPAHSPHVVAQVRVAPGERIALDVALSEGSYRLRGPQLPFALDLRVSPAGTTRNLELRLATSEGGEKRGVPQLLRTGGQVVTLINDFAQELLVRVERAALGDDAFTAARASSSALFRKLFPEEVLASGQLVSVQTLTFLVTDLEQAPQLYEQLGDTQTFGLIHEHFCLIEEHIRQQGGALVKTVGEGVLASFHETAAAVRVGLDLQALLESKATTRGLRLRVGVHRGPVLAATLNDRLDYFGNTLKEALGLVQLAKGGELVVTQPVAADPAVAAMVRARNLEGEIVGGNLPGGSVRFVQRLVAKYKK